MMHWVWWVLFMASNTIEDTEMLMNKWEMVNSMLTAFTVPTYYPNAGVICIESLVCETWGNHARNQVLAYRWIATGWIPPRVVKVVDYDEHVWNPKPHCIESVDAVISFNTLFLFSFFNLLFHYIINSFNKLNLIKSLIKNNNLIFFSRVSICIKIFSVKNE